MQDFRKILNTSQLEAVEALDGPVLVIAGAGSGKTRVIEYRVLNLLWKGVSPHSILLLTFTRRAAAQMLHRTAERDPRAEGIEGGTFHSFGYRMLRRFSDMVGLPKTFSILDEDDIGTIIGRIASQLGFLDRKEKFPKKDTIYRIISASVNKDKSYADILSEEYPQFKHNASDIEDLAVKYKAHKREAGYLDYDDLLLYLRELLQHEDIRKELSNKYRYIMVDEYQDTNGLQADIVALLGKEHQNVMVVGDDAQSIYGFRGALHKNIIRFPEIFKNAKLVKLEDNYRSTQSVLNLANSVLENMESKFAKTLRAASNKNGLAPSVQGFSDPYEEADWVATSIKELNDDGIGIKKQAVLFRSSYVSLPLQAELTKRNIPYQVFGGLKFYEMAHVKDLLAYLRVLVNPKDYVSWNRILLLAPGIGAKTAEKITEGVLQSFHIDEALNIIENKIESLRSKEAIQKLIAGIKKAKDEEKVKAKFDAVIAYYLSVMREKYDDWRERMNDLEVLSQMAKRYVSLADLLADFTLDTPVKSQDGRLDIPGVDDEGVLTLSTIHSAKGLEWDTVFLIGLADGTLPSNRAFEDSDQMEEERRLFYVAITRAEKNLFLSYALDSGRGATGYNRMSRFLTEPNVIKNVSGMDFIKDEEPRPKYRESGYSKKEDDDISYEYDDAINRFSWR